MKIDDARVIAESLIKLLKPACNAIIIGGSIRRNKPEVKDIELICRPRIDQSSDLARLDNTTRDFNRLDEAIKALYRNNPILDRNRPRKNNASPPFGPHTYLIRYDGQPVDIFSIHPPADWFTQVVIRTGSAEFNKWLVTTCKARAKVRFIDGHIERQGLDRDNIPPGTEIYFHPSNEIDVFNICGIEHIRPEDRGENFMDYVIEL